MKSCCENKKCELEQLQLKQRKVLWVVFALNAVMFFVEFCGGIVSRSNAITGDSLDMLGDAFVYGLSLYAIGQRAQWGQRIGHLKGWIMLALGLFVMGQAGVKLWQGTLPTYETMGGLGLLALAVNSTCLALLYTHRSDDINMRSTWLCSRNDIIANLSTIFAAWGVSHFESYLPDVIVGVILAVLVMGSAVSVLRSPELKT